CRCALFRSRTAGKSRLRETSHFFARKFLPSFRRKVASSPFRHFPLVSFPISYADNQPTRAQRSPQGHHQVEVSGFGCQSFPSRGVRAGDDSHAEEAEFCDSEGGEGSSDERQR